MGSTKNHFTPGKRKKKHFTPGKMTRCSTQRCLIFPNYDNIKCFIGRKMKTSPELKSSDEIARKSSSLGELRSQQILSRACKSLRSTKALMDIPNKTSLVIKLSMAVIVPIVSIIVMFMLPVCSIDDDPSCFNGPKRYNKWIAAVICTLIN